MHLAGAKTKKRWHISYARRCWKRWRNKGIASVSGDNKKIDVAALLSTVDIVNVIDAHVPLKKNGVEYEACCPFHTEASPSFKVSPVKQFYHCFGCGAHGDAIKFLQEYQGLSFIDAVKALGGDVSVSATATPARERAPAVEKKRSRWEPILPAPADAPEPPKAHVMRGIPERVWRYLDASKQVLGYVYRFKTSEGGKEVLPLTWCRNVETGATEWHWMAFPEPRPLYGLDYLAARPDATVLVVEGEKCADAGLFELDELVVVSWPGGGKAAKKVDWSPLAGRKVILWPDADAKRVPLTPEEKAAGVNQTDKPLLDERDQPGIKTMVQIAGILAGLECKLWMMQIPPPGEKPDGWDIADAVEERLTGSELADYIRANIIPVAAANQGVESDSDGASTPPPASAGDYFSDDDANAWRRTLLRKDDRLIDCRENVYLMLKNHPEWSGVIWVDEFARKIVKRKPAPWDDAALFVPGVEWNETESLRLGLWMAQQERLLVRSADNLAAAVSWAATDHEWHPVKEYFESLSWDGTNRLGDWLTDYLGVKKTEYSSLAGSFFLIGMVARIYRSGCVMRAMPIFEGGQFKGKSTALRILGGDWFSDSPIDLNNKDAYQLIQGVMLYEIAELDAFNKAESTRIKSFISSTKDRFRAPYERAPKDHLRQVVFAGTTNQDEYFKDQTGNTRYWPLRVEESGPINHDGLIAARDQLFAEAVARFKLGERWHPTRDEQQRLFEPEQEAREIADPWQSMIFKWLNNRSSDRVTVNEILSDLLKIEPGKIDGNRQMSTRIGIAMKRIGWDKKRETDGSRDYYYLRPKGWGSVFSSNENGGGDAPF